MAENLLSGFLREVPRHLESHPLAFRCRFCGTYQRVPWMPMVSGAFVGRFWRFFFLFFLYFHSDYDLSRKEKSSEMAIRMGTV